MPGRSHLVAAALFAFAAVMPASAQYRAGSPVDRNVDDAGANAASQRYTQPGLGQFGVGSILLNRFADPEPFEPARVDPYTADQRATHRQQYMLHAPGYTALMDRPDYLGPSPDGGWVFNQQTADGAEILTLTGANTVFVLSPELLQTNRPTPIRPHYEPDPNDHPYRVQPQTQSDPYALMRDAQVNRTAYSPQQRTAPPRHNNYRHPEIIERQRKLREEREREAEQAEEQAVEASTEKDAEQTKAEEEDAPGQP